VRITEDLQGIETKGVELDDLRPGENECQVTTFQLIGLEPPKKLTHTQTERQRKRRKRSEKKRRQLYSALARRKLKLNFAICQLIIYLKSN